LSKKNQGSVLYFVVVIGVLFVAWSLVGNTACSPAGGSDGGTMDHHHHHHGDAGSDKPDKDYSRTRNTDGGSFKVTFIPKPDPIPYNKHFTMEIKVEGAKDPKISAKIVLKVDAGMPTHQHGMNTEAKVKKVSDNKFEVEGLLFHMRGYWELTVDIEADGKKEKAIFSIYLD